MHFDFIDSVLDCSEDRIVTLKQVSAAEEYLQEHFPTFPVLPGVFMLEAMMQAARRLLTVRTGSPSRHTLETVRALKYGAMVRPGEGLRVEVALSKEHGEGRFDFKGSGTVVRAPEMSEAGESPRTAVSGRFTLRPIRTLAEGGAPGEGASGA